MKKPNIHPLPDAGFIAIRGARQNNLKGIDLDIPLGRLSVISGPSGSGKSSLAFDTIYAEGQRRYVETFSPYTRQFLERMDKPQVDEIRGIPPAIAIEQRNAVKTTRSTVGTITEINDYLKVLMPRIARGHCPSCSREIRPETARSVADHAFIGFPGRSVFVAFGIPVPAKTESREFFSFLQQQGFLRVFLDGKIARTDEPPSTKRLPALVLVVQDRLAVTGENRARFIEAVETALRFGKGKITLIELDEVHSSSFLLHPFSTGWHCAHCDIDITPPSPALFSFNNPLGACPKCRGFGRVIGIDLDRAIPDRSLSIAGGCVKPFQSESGRECQRDLLRACGISDIDPQCPFDELCEADQNFVIFGEDAKSGTQELWENKRWYGVRGFFDWLESKAYKMHVRVLLSRYRSYTTCEDCGGARFQPATLNFRVDGKTLPQLAAMSLGGLLAFIESRKSKNENTNDSTIKTLLDEIASRLRYLVEVGVGYLTLDRPTRSLSGGEVERVNLTTCLGTALVNTLFVMDEPTVGLHPRDVGRLIRVMKNLRDKGNTLLVVEHEEAVIRSADNLIELGPGRGEAGGELVFTGSVEELVGIPESGYRKPESEESECNAGTENLSGFRYPLSGIGTLTADYLTGRKSIPVPAKRRKPKAWLKVLGASEHNLKNIAVEFPLGVFVCVTGVSGSGKSTLVHDVLFQNLRRMKGEAGGDEPGRCKKITGADRVGRIVMVDQSPLARTPRSSPALYLGVFDFIREQFALTPDSRAQGLTAGSFSFNSGNGRCERCGGMGFEKIEMQFLSDVFVRCPECEGKKYQSHILKIRLNGRSVHDLLEMTVSESIRFFGNDERIAAPLRLLDEVGLGYLRLGQPLNVLSGGESQRLKLVSEMRNAERGVRNGNGSLLIFDEPTTGLHFDDVAMLLRVFQRLVDEGNTVLVIEHNLEVIKCADHVIDLGPEAGDDGGCVIATGTPEEIAGVDESHTGKFLRQALGSTGVPPVGDGVLAVADFPSARVAEQSAIYEVHRGETPSPTAGTAVLPGAANIANGNAIRIVGAREHNLKNISLAIPRDKMVVITGLSGSGKSTLAFDILFAEGQRRFLDSMSPYARQFMEQLEKPDVDSISGLPPTVAIEQRVTRGGGKSSVATVTEVYHFLRLLFAKLGTQHCPECQLPVESQTVAAIAKRAELIARKGRVRVLAPLVKARKGFHTDVAKWALKEGFTTLLVDGKFAQAEGFKKLERFQEHTIDVLVGESGRGKNLREIVARALEVGRGTAKLLDAKNRVTILSTHMSCPGCGQSFEELDPRLFSFNSPHGWCEHCHGFGEIWETSPAKNDEADSVLEAELDEERRHESLDENEAKPCPVCAGSRLNSIARSVRVQDATIEQFVALSSAAALRRIERFKFAGERAVVARDIVGEIRQRLRFMSTVGLDYLTLNRSAKTLSGGESQRIRLAAQLGSNLRGVLYVLDEPTIGLHPRDNRQLLDTLEALKKKGNSLVVVEHDEDTMRRADFIIDLGPAAGIHGGEVVASGTLGEIRKNPHSATARCLNKPLRHPTHGERRPLQNIRWLELLGARTNNLKNIDVKIPVGRFTAISGISGSGKSTLMETLREAARAALLKKPRMNTDETRMKRTAGKIRVSSVSFRGAEFLENVIEVDQSPIGKTSRSTPATYVGVFDEIRKQFAQLPLARMRGYTASRFSFNTEGGRCETCAGQGVIKVEMQFLPPTYIPCGECHGKRYNAQTLEVAHGGKSIGDVLDMSIEEAAAFFAFNPRIHRALALLADTGLGYLKLGQASPTLSGGEAQRLKLVSELTRGVAHADTERIRRQRAVKSTLYLLEEPTIGLHMADVARLLDVLHRLVNTGNTVVVIEHNLDVICDADFLVDVGPEAGENGGRIVASGTPEQVAKSKTSRTAPFLREILSR